VSFKKIERFRPRVTDDDTRSLLNVRFYKYINSRLLTHSIYLVDMILCTKDWHVSYVVSLRTVVAGQPQRRTCTWLLQPEVA
jgi:hypothetical protein